MDENNKDAEMIRCDKCGEYWPKEEMYELVDDRIVCPICEAEIIDE